MLVARHAARLRFLASKAARACWNSWAGILAMASTPMYSQNRLMSAPTSADLIQDDLDLLSRNEEGARPLQAQLNLR